jgi:hypothetical protein
MVKESAAHCNVVFFLLILVASGYFGYVAYHQFYLGVLGLHMVAFGFVWFAGCGCLECSCCDGSSVVCWSAGIVICCGVFTPHRRGIKKALRRQLHNA